MTNEAAAPPLPKPSEISLRRTYPPLADTLGKSEFETMAAVLVRACEVHGDRWQPLSPEQVAKVIAADVEAKRNPIASMNENPFLRPDLPGLVASGHAHWVGGAFERVELTEDAFRLLAKKHLLPRDVVETKHAIRFLLTRIGSWTHARWDQHLRHEVGDDRAKIAIDYIEEVFSVKEYAEQPASANEGFAPATREPVHFADVMSRPAPELPQRQAWRAFVEVFGRCWCGSGREGTAGWACRHVRCIPDLPRTELPNYALPYAPEGVEVAVILLGSLNACDTNEERRELISKALHDAHRLGAAGRAESPIPKPSDIALDMTSPPLADTLGDESLELAAAIVVRVCAADGDRWRSVSAEDCYRRVELDLLEKKEPIASMNAGPNLRRPDIVGLVRAGHARWADYAMDDVVLTEETIRALHEKHPAVRSS